MKCGGVGAIRIFDSGGLFRHHDGLCLFRLAPRFDLNHMPTGFLVWCDRWFGFGNEGLLLLAIGCDDLG